MKVVFSISSVFILLLLTVFLLGGCENKEDNKTNDSTTSTKVITTTTNTPTTITTTKKVENNNSDDENITLLNCEDCVFAFHTNKKTYGDTLTNYTKNFKTIKDKNGNQRRRFMGYIIDENNTIIKGYACGIEEEKVFCIEGTIDGNQYEDNISILNRVYSDVDCEYTANGNTYVCVGETNSEVRADGYVSVQHDNSCIITGSTGQMYCN